MGAASRRNLFGGRKLCARIWGKHRERCHFHNHSGDRHWHLKSSVFLGGNFFDSFGLLLYFLSIFEWNGMFAFDAFSMGWFLGPLVSRTVIISSSFNQIGRKLLHCKVDFNGLLVYKFQPQRFSGFGFRKTLQAHAYSSSNCAEFCKNWSPLDSSQTLSTGVNCFETLSARAPSTYLSNEIDFGKFGSKNMKLCQSEWRRVQEACHGSVKCKHGGILSSGHCLVWYMTSKMSSVDGFGPSVVGCRHFQPARDPKTGPHISSRT